MAICFSLDNEDINIKDSINNHDNLFYKYKEEKPSLHEALLQMFNSCHISEKEAEEYTNDIICKTKNIVSKNISEIKNKYPNIGKHDALIISSYTCESKNEIFSPYKILNSNLVSKNRVSGIKNISKYLFILLKSLRKLPKYYPTSYSKNLYRCINVKVNINSSSNTRSYTEGITKTFWGFTSASSNKMESFNFLGKKKNIKTGTIFILSGEAWGYDISLFNYYGENEILIEPERKFIVLEVIPPPNDIIYISCKILNTPLVLSNIINKYNNYNIIPNFKLPDIHNHFQINTKYNKNHNIFGVEQNNSNDNYNCFQFNKNNYNNNNFLDINQKNKNNNSNESNNFLLKYIKNKNNNILKINNHYNSSSSDNIFNKNPNSNNENNNFFLKYIKNKNKINHHYNSSSQDNIFNKNNISKENNIKISYFINNKRNNINNRYNSSSQDNIFNKDKNINDINNKF